LSYWQWTAFGGVSYADFWRKADLVFSVFDNYDRILDVVCFALFLGFAPAGSAGPGGSH
jgi:hypothetical protein